MDGILFAISRAMGSRILLSALVILCIVPLTTQASCVAKLETIAEFFVGPSSHRILRSSDLDQQSINSKLVKWNTARYFAYISAAGLASIVYITKASPEDTQRYVWLGLHLSSMIAGAFSSTFYLSLIEKVRLEATSNLWRGATYIGAGLSAIAVNLAIEGSQRMASGGGDIVDVYAGSLTGLTIGLVDMIAERQYRYRLAYEETDSASPSD